MAPIKTAIKISKVPGFDYISDNHVDSYELFLDSEKISTGWPKTKLIGWLYVYYFVRREARKLTQQSQIIVYTNYKLVTEYSDIDFYKKSLLQLIRETFPCPISSLWFFAVQEYERIENFI
jgi:hypothetical protein